MVFERSLTQLLAYLITVINEQNSSVPSYKSKQVGIVVGVLLVRGKPSNLIGTHNTCEIDSISLPPIPVESDNPNS